MKKQVTLTSKQVEYLIDILDGLELDEGTGWDVVMGIQDRCCPGDDTADIFNLAIAKVRKQILDIEE